MADLDFEWVVAPPESKSDRIGKYAAILAEIAKTDHAWARIPMTGASGAGTLAREIKRGKKAPGQWEAVSRRVDGQHYTYVRYLGP